MPGTENSHQEIVADRIPKRARTMVPLPISAPSACETRPDYLTTVRLPRDPRHKAAVESAAIAPRLARPPASYHCRLESSKRVPTDRPLSPVGRRVLPDPVLA